MGQPNRHDGLEILYANPNFLLDSIPGVRDYQGNVSNGDRIIRVTANHYWYKTEDLGRMIQYLLMNKEILAARKIEAQKIYQYIQQCFNGRLPL